MPRIGWPSLVRLWSMIGWLSSVARLPCRKVKLIKEKLFVPSDWIVIWVRGPQRSSLVLVGWGL